MLLKQKTIAKSVSASGVSLHFGQPVTLTFKPGNEGSGIVFRRVDLEGKPKLRASYELTGDLLRNTTISEKGISVSTVEHVLSALVAMQIDNVVVDVEGPEPPIFDGSSRKFVEMLKEAGIEEQTMSPKIFKLDRTVSIVDGDRSILAAPHDGLKVTCTFTDARGGFTQHASFEIDPDGYAEKIAPARTFTFYEDIESLLKQGKIKGGSLDTALVIKGDKVLSKEPLRFDDEFVRHKILDIIGDIGLLGCRLNAHIIAIKPGHALNSKLTASLAALMKGEELPANDAEDDESVESDEPLVNIQEILKLLPHRYPLLLVDKVIEIEGDTIRAIKNVTINEPYFVGHFPNHPVVPGVLQIETMAQAAGILMVKKIEEQGKLALFMSCDKVKFRKPVVPGDQMLVEATLTRTRGKKMGVAVAKCLVNNTVVSSAELTFALVDEL
jgi:UDP-3-O-[3-hydroxymyristoyl] N-acetylglucosamine deacetylase/3-hydroxyacyl-[acyl-carrier-protein] dehydratase